MTIVVALTLSVLFQFIAAVIAISLIRHTRYNISWVLISAAFLMMAFRRLIELFRVWETGARIVETPFGSWMAVVISIFMLAGVIFIKRIFNIQKRIDELKKESETRVLSAIIRTEESERQKFAKELHDGLGPLLASIKMSISALVSDRTEPGQKKILDNTGRLIDESVSTIKEISNKLSPHVLDNFGLIRAVQSFIDRLGLPGTLQIKVNSNLGELRFDHNIEVILYRIISELITNTINHAGATEVNIDLYHEHGRLKLDYFDNGRGFDPERVLEGQKGMGYSNIQSRIKSIGGTLNILSNVDEGVCISIEINTADNG